MYYLCAKTKAFFPMKRIGILSDTHSFWDEKYAEYLGECDEIWHAGDFGSLQVADRLSALRPLRGVCGNCDGQDLRLRFPEVLRFRCEEVEVLMKHIGGYPGHYDFSIRRQIYSRRIPHRAHPRPPHHRRRRNARPRSRRTGRETRRQPHPLKKKPCHFSPKALPLFPETAAAFPEKPRPLPRSRAAANRKPPGKKRKTSAQAAKPPTDCKKTAP